MKKRVRSLKGAHATKPKPYMTYDPRSRGIMLQVFPCDEGFRSILLGFGVPYFNTFLLKEPL